HLHRRHRRHHPLLVARQERQLLPRIRHPRPHHPPAGPRRLRSHPTQQKANPSAQTHPEDKSKHLIKQTAQSHESSFRTNDSPFHPKQLSFRPKLLTLFVSSAVEKSAFLTSRRKDPQI